MNTPVSSVVFTKDWHKKNDPNGGHIALPPAEPDYVDSWPVHCIAGTKGASLHPALKSWDNPKFAYDKHALFRKGYGCPSYSGFDDSSEFPGYGNGLADFLHDRDVTHVSVAGLAADYCVRATALDAVNNDFDVRVMGDLTRSINTPTEEVVREVVEAQAHRAKVLRLATS